MNQTEALTLVGYLNRAGLLQALEGQAPVWADALDDVAINDARESARALAKTTARWVTPGDIRAGVKTLVRQRVQDLQIPAPPESIHPDDTATERAWVRAYVAAIGAGQTPDVADVTACASVAVTRPLIDAAPRPVAELVESVASTTRIPRTPAVTPTRVREILDATTQGAS
jgi:hypothetical protein